MLDTTPFEWITDEKYASLTLAIVDGVPEADVIRAYGGDPDSAGIRTFADSAGNWDDDGPYYVQTFTNGPRVVAIENNSFTGSDVSTARKAVGDHGRFVSIKWSVTGGHDLVSLVNGQVDGDCDLLSFVFDGEPNGPVPGWVSRVDWTNVGNPRPGYLALLSDVMGVQVQPDWFEMSHRTTPIP